LGSLVVTGGLGFIGSHFTRAALSHGYEVAVIDKNTYAADVHRLSDLKGDYALFEGDICDIDFLQKVSVEFPSQAWVHFAAESHVDRSIESGESFLKTNVFGTVAILETLLKTPERKSTCLIHMSTDEVFGSLDENEPQFTLKSGYDPRSPYSASKASSDHFVRAWRTTHGLKASIVNSSNNFGPWQHPEKLIPKTIFRALTGLEIPIYGDGRNRRDWIHVLDVCDALLKIVELECWESDFLLGTGHDISNLEVVELICHQVDKLCRSNWNSQDLMRFVQDRKGHDFRYSVNSMIANQVLKWKPKRELSKEIEDLVVWSIDNLQWLRSKVEN